MPLYEGGPCAECGSDATKANAWSGQAGGPRYCHLRACQRAGVEAGHIMRQAASSGKRRRDDEDSERFFCQGMELLKLKAFVGSKAYKRGALQGVLARRAPLSEEQQEFRIEVYGKFKLGEADPGGYDYLWMTVDQLLECDNVNEEELTQARLMFRTVGEDGWPSALG